MSDDKRRPQDAEDQELLLEEWRQERMDAEKSGLEAKKLNTDTWERKRFKKMVWATRYSVVKSVIIAMLSLYFLYMIYLMIATIWYQASGKNDQFIRYAETLIETHEPGLSIDKRNYPKVEVTGLLAQKTKLKAFWLVGEWEVNAGEIEVKKSLFSGVSYNFHPNERYLNESSSFSSFALPPGLVSGDPDQKLKTNEMNEDWERLAHMEDGYVGQLAFSTVSGMKPQQLMQVLSKYDVHISAMPVYAGELRAEGLMKISHGSSGPLQYVSALSLRPYVQYDDSGRGRSWTHWIGNQETLEKSEQQFLTDLGWLLNQGSYYHQEIDQARLDYLRDHGIAVYGAIVTGPIRELEKLRTENQFHLFQLGRVEPWNWRDKPLAE